MEDVWIINREYKPGEVKNKNELPSALLIKLTQYLSKPGDVVCDFFLGGFSTAKIARGLGRSAVGFEINKRSFDYHHQEVEQVRVNELADQVRLGKDDTPTNAGEPWDEAELNKLRERYLDLRRTGKTKKRTTEILAGEFQRGNWSIMKRLDALNIDEHVDSTLAFRFDDK